MPSARPLLFGIAHFQFEPIHVYCYFYYNRNYTISPCDCVLFAGVQIKSQIGQFVWIRNKASFPDRDATHAEVREFPQLARASRSDGAMECSHEIGYRLTNCILNFLRLSVLRAYQKKGTRTLKTEISDVIRSEKG